ncbi:MAG: hypothetical protein QXJ02_06245 [Candidatus Bathyarchaeia archaeon]
MHKNCVCVFFLLLLMLPMIAKAEQEEIDSDVDYSANNHVKLSTILYKDTSEGDPNWDFYAVKVTVEDLWTKDDFWSGPLIIEVYVYFPSYADEVPTNHMPKAGWQWSSGSWSYSYQGIGLSGQIPLYGISYKSGVEGDYYCAKWVVHSTVARIFALWYVMDDYADFAVGVRVPEGASCFAYSAAWVCYYGLWPYPLLFYSKSFDDVGWCHVGASATPPSFPAKNSYENEYFYYKMAGTSRDVYKCAY